MVFIGEGDIMLASVLFFVGNIGVSGSPVFYDSLLPHVAKPRRNRSRVVGRLRDGLHQRRRAAADQPGVDPAARDVRLRQLGVGDPRVVRLGRDLVGGVFDSAVQERAGAAGGSGRDGGFAIGAAFTRLGQTFREIRRYRHAFLLFIAMLLYQDGIQTVIRMSSVYGAEVGIDQNAQIAAFVMVQFVGIPFAFLFGALGSRIGTKRCLFIAIGVYIAGGEPRLLHDQRDALLPARVPDRHGAGRLAGAQPRVVRAADSARSDVGVLWLLRRIRALCDGVRAGAVHDQRAC